LKKRPGAKAPLTRAFFVGLKPYANPEKQQQIPPLRCGMTNKKPASMWGEFDVGRNTD
jgi:hypothetical protein